MTIRLKHALIAITLLAIGGCGSTPQRAATTTSPASAPSTTTTTSPATVAASPATRRQARQRAYNGAYDELPFHSGPLNVAQILLNARDPSFLDVRVTARSFFCSHTPAQRLAAVRDYYHQALAKVRGHGANTLTLRVSRLMNTGAIGDVYARADANAVALTTRGAGAPTVAC